MKYLSGFHTDESLRNYIASARQHARFTHADSVRSVIRANGLAAGLYEGHKPFLAAFEALSDPLDTAALDAVKNLRESISQSISVTMNAEYEPALEAIEQHYEAELELLEVYLEQQNEIRTAELAELDKREQAKAEIYEARLKQKSLVMKLPISELQKAAVSQLITISQQHSGFREISNGMASIGLSAKEALEDVFEHRQVWVKQFGGNPLTLRFSTELDFPDYRYDLERGN